MNISVLRGIRGKLITAFGCAVAATLIACMISNAAMLGISKSLSDITEHSLPSMAQAMRLSASGVYIAAIVDDALKAESQAERIAVTQAMNDAVSEVSAIVEKIDREGGLSGSRAQVLDDLEAVKADSVKVGVAVDNRLETRKQLDDLLRDSVSLRFDINEKLGSLIETASADFLNSIDGKVGGNFENIDATLGVQFETLIATLKMFASSASAENALYRVTESSNSDDLGTALKTSIERLEDVVLWSSTLNDNYVEQPDAIRAIVD